MIQARRIFKGSALAAKVEASMAAAAAAPVRKCPKRIMFSLGYCVEQVFQGAEAASA
jgi:hypothetical protein